MMTACCTSPGIRACAVDGSPIKSATATHINALDVRKRILRLLTCLEDSPLASERIGAATYPVQIDFERAALRGAQRPERKCHSFEVGRYPRLVIASRARGLKK